MTVEVPNSVERDLRALAETQGREVDALVEEAIQNYLDGARITDLEPGAAAESQLRLSAELPDLPPWEADPG